jgi:hypothetical protein
MTGMSVTRRWAAAIVFGCLAASCAGPTFVVQQYDGPVRASETIAIIRVNGKDPIRLDVLDGEVIGTRVEEDARLHVEVLPGRHSLRVRDLSDPDAQPGRASFMAEAGRVYRPIVFAPRPSEWGGVATVVRIFEVDAGSDAQLRDVTLPEAAAPVPRTHVKPPDFTPAPEIRVDAGVDAGVDAAAGVEAGTESPQPP